jgi:hypothetical protein
VLYNTGTDSHPCLPESHVLDNEDQQSIRNKIEQLRLEHRDLDDIISRLGVDPGMDQLQLRRLKNRKLMIKDIVARLESLLIPDMDA